MAEKKRHLIAVIDDDEAARVSLKQMLVLRNYRTETFSSAEAALAWPDLAHADTIITDVKMPGMDGEQLLGEIQRHNITIPVIMITGHGDISMAVRCLKGGAYDFIEKPFDDEVLIACVSRSVESIELKRETQKLRRQLNMLSPGEDGRFGIIGRSRVMQDMFEQIELCAGSEAPVLIRGETGSGKELAARAIHVESARSEGQFVPVNAGAIPENMIESELFGHVKGAFTGANSDRDGKIITASGGTLMLDEIESLSLPAQVKLLRTLDDGEVYPVGKDTPVQADMRLVATAKEEISEEVKKGNMRKDFFHRIAVLRIDVPSLRERKEDIPLLTAHFIREAAERNGIPVPEIEESTLNSMMRHQWPGNVRELKNSVERMVITSHNGRTGSFESDEQSSSEPLLSLPATPGRLKDELERVEQTVIEAVLRECGGEITATAETLGISRRALYDRMKKYDLQKEDFR